MIAYLYGVKNDLLLLLWCWSVVLATVSVTVQLTVATENRIAVLFTVFVSAFVLSMSSVRRFATKWTVVCHCDTVLYDEVKKAYDLESVIYWLVCCSNFV